MASKRIGAGGPFLISPQVPAGSTSPLAAFVSNAATPQIADYSLIAGIGFFLASAITPQGQANASEYQFGTHAQAIHQAEAVKSDIWGSARTPPTPAAAPLRSIWAPPQLVDLTQQPLVWESLFTGKTPTVPPLTANGLPQADPSQMAANVWKSVAAPAVAPGPVPKIVLASQDDTSQIAAQVIASAISPQGQANAAEFTFGLHAQALHQAENVKSFIVPAASAPPAPPAPLPLRSIWASAQQADPTQIAGNVWESQPAAPPVGPIPALTVGGIPQADPSQISAKVWNPSGPPPATSAPLPLRSIWASPESVDLSIGAWSVGGTLTNQGSVPPTSLAPPQSDPTQIAPIVWGSQPFAPPIGRVPPQTSGTPQADPSQLAAQLWAFAPVKQGPVPPFTTAPITDFSQTGGYQIAATIFPSATSAAAAPPNLHKLYLDVTTGKLYWQVSQTSNPTLIIPL